MLSGGAGSAYISHDGSTPSEDDSSQHSDAGMSMGGLSGGPGGPGGALAPEKRSDEMMMIQASPDAEITGGQSPADFSVRLIG
eukprot:361921-Chlamydomonas_euryale.AAC.15